MIISVTQTDIDQGDCAYCPVERGFAREGLDTMVGPTDVSFFLPQDDGRGGLVTHPEAPSSRAKRYIITLPLPPIARAFVKTFDALPRDPELRSRLLNQVDPVSLPQPFSFDLEIPAEVLEHART